MASSSSYTFTSPVVRWIDQRLPIFSMMRGQVIDFPTPKNLNYFWTFGGILMFCLLAQIVTGVVLAMHYAPNVNLAFESIQLIRRNVNYGNMIQPMHAVGASMFFLAVYIHIGRGLYYGSYKAPREILWMLGVLIYIVMMATAFMGYVLPWGQMSFWGAMVITNLFSAIPWVGDAIVTLLWGGFSVDNPTLNRFFALHYLLPFVLVGLVFLHIWALHVPGNGNPSGVDVQSPKETLPFHPFYTIKDTFAIVVFLIVFMAFVFFAPDYLGHPINYAPANPLFTPPHIVPEWYFLPFYAILRSIPDKLFGVVAMFGSIGVLFVLPWLDTSSVRSANYRPLYRQIFWIFVLCFLTLGVVGSQPPEGIWLLVGRLATAYYFLHFLVIVPLVGIFEKPDNLPSSISDWILRKGSRRGLTVEEASR